MKLVIALDLNSKAEILKFANEIKAANFDQIVLKIGLYSYLRDGNFINELLSIDKRFEIFLDLKFYDIPNTMNNALKIVEKFDISMLTIHASSGTTAMKLLSNELKIRNSKIKIFAVSALTSFSAMEFREIYNQEIEEFAIKASKLAKACGIDGMVCSAFESQAIKQNYDLLTLCPAIRPFPSAKDDQNRVADIAFAKSAKADYIVIGRPIYEAADKLKSLNQILELMQ